MKYLARPTAVLLAFFQFFAFVPTTFARVAFVGEKRMLMVSAYYSPLPAQRFYMRGSYEADKKLNGNGTNGADGTQVYVGMLAAPKTYPFGTQVRIPGLGVGTVHDRGGAILAKKGYDRIDVWMGSGEEGLSRALNWGMRLVEGEVSFVKDSMEPELDYIWISSELPKDTLNRLMARTMLNPTVFSQPITKASSKANISDLQEALRMFGYYHGEVNGVYNSDTREAVMVFQISEGILQNEKAIGAGNLGPKTLATLKSKIENFNSTILKEQGRLRGNLAELASGLGKKEEGDKVYRMQQMMWELGYYKGALNGKYDSATMDAVFEFQKDNGIVQNDWESGAGYYGKKTHTALVAAIDRKIEKLMKYPAEMQVWVPAEVPLPKLGQLTVAPNMNERQALNFNLTISVVSKPVTASFAVMDLKLNQKSEAAAKLQKVLVKKGYLAKGLDTGYFGEKTKNALIRFQLGEHIIRSEQDAGAGNIGPKTLAVLNEYLTN